MGRVFKQEHIINHFNGWLATIYNYYHSTYIRFHDHDSMGMWSMPKRAKLREWLGSGQTSNGQFPLEVGPLLSACHGDSIRKIWGSCGAKDGVHLGSTQEPVLAMFESMKSGSQ